MDAAVTKLKLVVVGDSYVGKTSLLFAYTQKKFLGSYNTTVFDNWAISVSIENRMYNINLFDTAGQEDYQHLRSLSYPHTDVFMLCFALNEQKSLDAVRNTWLPEVRKYAGDSVPVILVGTKEDLLDNSKEWDRNVLATAEKAAREMGCSTFVACSSLTHKGLKRAFDEAFLAAIGINVKPEPSNDCCIIL